MPRHSLQPGCDSFSFDLPSKLETKTRNQSTVFQAIEPFEMNQPQTYRGPSFNVEWTTEGAIVFDNSLSSGVTS